MKKSFQHSFQRLPSQHELDVQPSTSYAEGIHAESASLRSPAFGFDGLTPHVGYDQLQGGRVERPAESASWASSRTFKAIGFLSHLVLTLVPVAFIVLAFLALSADGKPPSERANTVFEAARLGPSVFPIVFAAVVGRLMRTFALWRAERGSTIGLLEQLNGSQNLLAAVERSLLLPSLWGWSVAIIVLWALSPLGGQSSLRVLELGESGNSFAQELYYFNTDNYSDTIFSGASAYAYGSSVVQAIYQASLLAPASVRSSTTDTWGNVKIPLIQAQPAFTDSPAQDWFDVQYDNDTIFSSLTGIITSGLRSTTASNFTMETSYINLTCLDVTLFSTGDPNANRSDPLEEFWDWLGDVFIHTNKSSSPFLPPTAGDATRTWNSFMIDTNFNGSNMTANVGKPVNLIYASQNVDNYQIAAYNCSVGSTHVESLVGCNDTICQVNRMRPSRVFTSSSVETPWNQLNSFVPFWTFLIDFPWMAGMVHSAEVNPADYYVNGNNTPFLPPSLNGVNYTNVSGAQIEHRLGALVNTVWQSSIAQSSLTRPPPANYAATGPNYPFVARSVNSTMRTSEIVYHANRTWVALTATISFVLFACGVAGFIFRYMTKAPDILGYVSTMTRDNPYFDDRSLSDADNLNGLERARLLRDVVVQISNVKPWQERGHIALKSVTSGESRKTARLKRNQTSPRPTPLGAPV